MDEIKIINGELEFICEDVSEAEGFEVPTTRDVFIDPPEREGSLFIGEIAGMREMSWKGLIRDDIQANRRLLARICQPGGLKTIQFTLCDGVDVQILATLKLTNAYSIHKSVYLISAKAPYPYFESQELHTLTTGITVRRGGMPIAAAIAAPIGAGGGGNFYVLNSGDIYSRPQFQIKGPGTNFLITNIDTNKSIRLNTTLSSAETVIIDTKINEAYKGSQNVFGLTERTPIGSWITLNPGNNRFSFSATSGSTSATQLSIIYRDAYSGF